MEEIEPYQALLKQDLFADFEFQLRKDCEGAGMPLDSESLLPCQFEELKHFLTQFIFESGKNQSSQLPQLLYRIDVSEAQIKKYGQNYPALSFESIIVELIIKRELQKIILRKRYSSK
jgi:hypothetical protein